MAEMIIGGASVNVLVEGPENAPVLMLSNSLGTNLHMWDGQMAALHKTFRTVRYDTRGHGRTVVTGGTYSIAGLGRDAVAIMDALHLDRVHWLGLSMGGMIGQWLLVNARERIGRAVLANTSSRLPPPEMWNTRIRTVLSQGMHAITPTVIDRWFTPEFQERNPGEIARIAEMLHTTPAHGYAACCGAIRDMDQRESIRSVSNPVLVVVGKRDPATPPEMGAEIAAAIRDANLVALDAAHLSNVEAPAAFNKAVVEFLASPLGRFAPPRPAPKAKLAAKTKLAVKAKLAAKTKPGKKPVAKAKAPTRTAAKKAVAKKSAAKKPAAKKVAAKKVAAKSTARKPAGKSIKAPARAVKKPLRAAAKAARKPAKKVAKKAARGRR